LPTKHWWSNPEVSSVRDSDRILGIIQAKSRRALLGGEPVKEHLLITRYSPKRVSEGEMLSYKDVQEILRVPIIGVIPESEAVLQSSNAGTPAIHLVDSDVAGAYLDVVGRFLGENIPLRFVDYEKPGLFSDCSGVNEHVALLPHLRQQAQDGSDCQGTAATDHCP
jgi:septum site-determining protein MinD